MHTLKWIALALGGLVVLLSLGIVGVLLWVDPNDYRDDIERLAEQRTGRALSIEGPLDLKLFPWLSLEAHNVALGNPPGFSAEPFVEVERARVGVRLVPLLSRRLEVSRIAVEGLAAMLVTRADGRSNWEGLDQSQTPTDPAGEVPETSIAGIDITRSSLLYRNVPQDSVTRLRNVELHTGALAGSDPVPLELRFTLDEGENTDATRLALEARIAKPAGAERIEVADFAAEGELITAPQPGEEPAPNVKFTARSPQLVIDYGAGTLEPAKLAITYGDVPLEMELRGERLFDERLLTGAVVVPRFSPRKVLPSLGIEAPETPPDTLERFEAQSSFRLTEQQLELPDLRAVLDATTLRGRLLVGDLDAETPSLRFDLTADALDVDRYLPPEPAESSATTAQQGGAPPPEEEPTRLPREALAELNAAGGLRIGRFTVADLAFSDVATQLDANKGMVKLGPTTAKLFGGRYRGMMVLDARSSPARLSLDEQAQGLDIEALVQAAFDSKRVSGRGNAAAKLTARGDTDRALFESLAGRIEFQVQDGALEGLDLWYELRRARALWQRESAPPPSGPVRTPFEVLQGSGAIDRGIVRSDDLRAETEYLKVRGTGTFNLETLAVDYRLTAEVYKIPPEGAGSEMAPVRAAEIPLTVTGTVADLNIRPDYSALVQTRVKREVEERVEEKKEVLRRKLEDQLKDLLGR